MVNGDHIPLTEIAVLDKWGNIAYSTQDTYLLCIEIFEAGTKKVAGKGEERRGEERRGEEKR